MEGGRLLALVQAYHRCHSLPKGLYYILCILTRFITRCLPSLLLQQGYIVTDVSGLSGLRELTSLRLCDLRHLHVLCTRFACPPGMQDRCTRRNIFVRDCAVEISSACYGWLMHAFPEPCGEWHAVVVSCDARVTRQTRCDISCVLHLSYSVCAARCVTH